MNKFQDLKVFKLPNNFRGRPGWFVQLWWIIHSLFFRTSPQFMYGWRRFLLRLFGANIGEKVIVRPSVHVQFPWKLTVGDHSWIGDDVVLYNLGEIVIGCNVVISQKGYLCTGSHNYKQHDFPIFAKKIVLEDECWLATDVFVAPGIKIGKGSIVGARSSVFKDIPPDVVCLGNPATIIKNRS